MSRDLTELFLKKRDIAIEEVAPRKVWLKNIMIQNNVAELKKFIKTSNINHEGSKCSNCDNSFNQVYYLNMKSSVCELCESVFCGYCVKSIDLLKDTNLKYIKIKLCRNCYIFTVELKYSIHPNLYMDKRVIELETVFNDISQSYTNLCTNISQLDGLIRLCESNKEFINEFLKEIIFLIQKIQGDVDFLNKMKKKYFYNTDRCLIINKMSKNLFLYLKIIRNKIIPCALEALNRSKQVV